MPVVSTAAPSVARQLLNSDTRTGKTGQLAIKFIEMQLRTHKENMDLITKREREPYKELSVVGEVSRLTLKTIPAVI